MKVKLMADFFAATEHGTCIGDNRAASGRRYKKGVHSMKASMRDFLPKSAIILEDDYVAPIKEQEPDVVPDDIIDAQQEIDMLMEADKTAEDNMKRRSK